MRSQWSSNVIAQSVLPAHLRDVDHILTQIDEWEETREYTYHNEPLEYVYADHMWRFWQECLRIQQSLAKTREYARAKQGWVMMAQRGDLA